jgi:MoxR-like ATPase
VLVAGFRSLGRQEFKVMPTSKLAAIHTPSRIEGSHASPATVAAIEKLSEQRNALLEQIGQVIVGQRDVIEQVLLTIFCGGHGLLVGVPGLAKTLLIRSLGRVLDLDFRRIQFTPDLMPSDITGTDIIEEDPVSGKRRIEFLRGPIFGNLILADEINRTPPKTQAAMLQTMQEHEVTVGSKTYPLPRPFHVFATQNPIEMEGTYVLPEAQADRFMFSIQTVYPSNSEEAAVVRATTGNEEPNLRPVLTGSAIVDIQRLVRSMPVSDEVIKYAVRLVARTRPEDPSSPPYVKEFVRWGASPRASQYLVLGAKGRAGLTGRFCADYEGVRSVAREVLRHRILLNFSARAQKVSIEQTIDRLLQDTPAPQ